MNPLNYLDPLRLSSRITNGDVEYTLECILPLHVVVTAYGGNSGTWEIEPEHLGTHYRVRLTVPADAVVRVFVEESNIAHVVLILVGEAVAQEVRA